MSSWSRLAGLPLIVDSLRVDPLEVQVASGWKRLSTVYRLAGAGHEGVGEDVTYEAPDQTAFRARWAAVAGAADAGGLAGRWDLAGFSARLEELAPDQPAPASPAARDFRRWAFESAALDLALRQAGTSLAALLEREPRPVTFVVSMGLGTPPDAGVVRSWRDLDPTLGFKLDASSSWDAALCRELAATGAVRCVDLKGYYHGTPVDQPLDRDLYARIVEHLTGAVIEDALWDEAVRDVLAPARERLSWDAPIHAVADVQALPFVPRWLNVKPSRLGSLERLFALYELAAEHDIATYGGGQFELGPGRGQAQLLASLFHPDAPNDLAPAAYNVGRPRAGLPPSPLELRPAATGFRLADDD